MTNAKNGASTPTAKPCLIDLGDSHKEKAAVLSKVIIDHMRTAARSLSYHGTFFGDEQDKDGIVDLACAHAALEEIVDEIDHLQLHVRQLRDELEEAKDEVAELKSNTTLIDPAPGENPEAVAYAKINAKNSEGAETVIIDGEKVTLLGNQDAIDYLLGAAGTTGGCEWKAA